MDVHVVHPGSNSRRPPQLFTVHIIHTTITSIDRAKCEQSRENTMSLAADEVIQTTRTFEFQISSWSFRHPIVEISIFLTSGGAEETD